MMGLALTIFLGWWVLGAGSSEKDAGTRPKNASEKDPNTPLVKVLASPARQFEIGEGEMLSIPLAKLVPQTVEGSLTFHAGKALPERCAIDRETGIVTWTPSETQGPNHYELPFLAKDAKGRERVRLLCQVQVHEVNQAPTLMLPETLQMVAGQTSVPLSANDPDLPRNTLTAHLEGSHPLGLKIDSRTMELSFDESLAPFPTGTHLVTLRVMDDGKPPQFVQRTIAVQFIDLLVADVPRQFVSEGQRLNVPIPAKFVGKKAAGFRYQLASNAPKGSMISRKTNEFTWVAPSGSGGTTHTVTVEVADAENAKLSRSVSFQIEVKRPSTLTYLDLPDLPRPQEEFKPVPIVKDPKLPADLRLNLFGFDSLDEQVSSEVIDEGKRISLIYHHPPARLKQKPDLPKTEPIGEFYVAGNQVHFQWEFHRDLELRKHQQLLREALLEIQAQGKSPKYYALRTPQTISSKELADVLRTPDPRPLIRWNTLPISVSRGLRMDQVEVELGETRHRADCSSLNNTVVCSLPDLADDLGYRELNLVFEQKADHLEWRIDTLPSVRDAYAKYKQLANKANSHQKSLRAVSNELDKNRRALNMAVASAQIKAIRDQITSAENSIARYQTLLANLKAPHDKAEYEYQKMARPLNKLLTGIVTGSVYRIVAGVRLEVLRIEGK